MKKLTRKSLLLLGLMANMVIFANGSIENPRDKETDITNISFDYVKEGSKLLIKDVEGIVLYKEPISKGGNYSKGFDLTSLPNGNYFFELDTDMEIVIIPFEVKSNQVEFDKEGEIKIFKPFVRVKDDMVYVSRYSFEKSPLEYNIFFADNLDLVREEKLAGDTYVTKVYDFSGAEKGEYLFVFEADGRKFRKTIKI